MPRPQPRIRPHHRDTDSSHSVLDLLLLDTKPSATPGARSRDPFADSIARDLHMLLNTRREERLLPPEFEQCGASILNFGIPDLTHCGALHAATEQVRLCRWLEDAIRLFEPRLRNISVRLATEGGGTPFLRFRLEAYAELADNRVSFEMGLKRDTGEMSVLPS